jgi:hypothetical protein
MRIAKEGRPPTRDTMPFVQPSPEPAARVLREFVPEARFPERRCNNAGQRPALAG